MAELHLLPANSQLTDRLLKSAQEYLCLLSLTDFYLLCEDVKQLKIILLVLGRDFVK